MKINLFIIPRVIGEHFLSFRRICERDSSFSYNKELIFVVQEFVGGDRLWLSSRCNLKRFKKINSTEIVQEPNI